MKKTDRQIAKNKEKLLDAIKKLGEGPMNNSVAERLVVYRGAYKALCLVEKEMEEDEDGLRNAGAEGMTRRQIKHWMEHLENEDGTTGPHYAKEQIEQYKRSLGLDCPTMELYAAANMMYSDYCHVLRKYGVDRIEVCMELAQAFLDDKDAGVKDKLVAYYEHIVEGK